MPFGAFFPRPFAGLRLARAMLLQVLRRPGRPVRRDDCRLEQSTCHNAGHERHRALEGSKARGRQACAGKRHLRSRGAAKALPHPIVALEVVPGGNPLGGLQLAARGGCQRSFPCGALALPRRLRRLAIKHHGQDHSACARRHSDRALLGPNDEAAGSPL